MDYIIGQKHVCVLVLHHTVKTPIMTHEMLISDPEGWWCGWKYAGHYAWESRTIVCVCSEKHNGCVHRARVYSSWPSACFRMTHISILQIVFFRDQRVVVLWSQTRGVDTVILSDSVTLHVLIWESNDMLIKTSLWSSLCLWVSQPYESC